MIKKAAKIGLTALAIAAFVWAMAQFRSRLRADSFLSGYVIFACVLFLASYNVRKKLPFLPLGRAATWLQLHIYVGWFTIAAFGTHIRWRWPNGVLESSLFGFFVFTAASGIYGLILSKVVPQRLARLREEVIFERIPQLRLQVQQTAHDLITQLLSTADAPALVDFYAQSLVPYFVRRRSSVYYLQPTSRLRNRLRSQLNSLDRYLTDEQRLVQQKLARLIDRRDDLDFHDAQQSKLKYWLFFHIGATYGLLILAGVHATMALAFRGGGL